MKNTKGLLVMLSLMLIICIEMISALPAGPVITYVSNSSGSSAASNRSEDAKGTITVVDMTVSQQDFKWKAYVGNVTGKLALDDGSAKTIYDWSLSTVVGEVYVTRASSVSWASVSCVNQTVINSEESALGFNSSISDSINSTFAASVHRTFVVGTITISNSTCRAINTYVNDSSAASNESSAFQEVLLKDNTTSSMIYSTFLEQDHLSYDGANTYDFQMIIAENESNTVPLTYYFYVELG